MHESIRQALRDGAIEAALEQARAWAVEAPTDAQAQRWLAVALRQAGRTQAAGEAIERAIALAPDDSDLHFIHAGLLLGDQAWADAEAALDRSVALNPNQLAAYVVQAQLALMRDEDEEAARLARLAERVDAESPQLAAVTGALALRRGDAEGALRILAPALERAPGDPQLLHAIGHAYRAAGHLAFAEQAFRQLLQAQPQARPLRLLLAQLLQAQGRPDEALAEVQGLLHGDTPDPALHGVAGELALLAEQPARAIEHLRQAMQGLPDAPRAFVAGIEAWRRLDDLDEAARTLDELAERHPQAACAWRARMQVAQLAGGDPGDVLQRWLAMAPEDLAPLEARLEMHAGSGLGEEADATARRILALRPGHAQANMHVLRGLIATDPQAAIVHVDRLLAAASGDDNRRLLQDWRAHALEAAGRYEQAAAQWLALHAEIAPMRAPLPVPTAAPASWPPAVAADPKASAVAFVFGLPGSGLERVLPALGAWFPVWRADRFGPNPPNDPFQYLDSAARVASGEIGAKACLQSWRAALPGRGIDGDSVIDWLPWWDNAWLLALRPRLPHARLLYALRDPRDMLLEWLRGNIVGVPFAMAEPVAAAQWLAAALRQMLVVQHGDLFPLRLLRMDDNTPELARDVLGAALDVDTSEAPVPMAVTSVQPAGHWRHYRQALAAPFAALQEVAVELGYPLD